MLDFDGVLEILLLEAVLGTLPGEGSLEPLLDFCCHGFSADLGRSFETWEKDIKVARFESLGLVRLFKARGKPRDDHKGIDYIICKKASRVPWKRAEIARAFLLDQSHSQHAQSNEKKSKTRADPRNFWSRSQEFLASGISTIRCILSCFSPPAA